MSGLVNASWLKVFDATAVRVEHALLYSAGSASGTGRAVAAGLLLKSSISDYI